ncbi:hypothetical protein HKX48_006594 [Thoreauomyces humboldtii]|nr:hypothetical protein HKX48_006594 [Thoreauomyces humboldtii]
MRYQEQVHARGWLLVLIGLAQLAGRTSAQYPTGVFQAGPNFRVSYSPPNISGIYWDQSNLYGLSQPSLTAPGGSGVNLHTATWYKLVASGTWFDGGAEDDLMCRYPPISATNPAPTAGTSFCGVNANNAFGLFSNNLNITCYPGNGNYTPLQFWTGQNTVCPGAGSAPNNEYVVYVYNAGTAETQFDLHMRDSGMSDNTNYTISTAPLNVTSFRRPPQVKVYGPSYAITSTVTATTVSTSTSVSVSNSLSITVSTITVTQTPTALTITNTATLSASTVTASLASTPTVTVTATGTRTADVTVPASTVTVSLTSTPTVTVTATGTSTATVTVSASTVTASLTSTPTVTVTATGTSTATITVPAGTTTVSAVVTTVATQATTMTRALYAVAGGWGRDLSEPETPCLCPRF